MLNSKHSLRDESDSDYEEAIATIEEELDDHEKHLESLVFGSEVTILDGISKQNKKKKNKKLKQLADAFEKRQVAWKDEDDDEVVDLKNLDKLSSKINASKSSVMKTTELEENLKAKFVTILNDFNVSKYFFYFKDLLNIMVHLFGLIWTKLMKKVCLRV